MDKDQERRERAYRIWEMKAGLTASTMIAGSVLKTNMPRQDAKPMRTEANVHASEEFNDKRREKSSGAHARPPWMAASD
jgi:hypothetical protein